MTAIKIAGTDVLCFDPKYNKYMKMGTKIGDVLFKKVASKHFMRVVDGYGLQYSAFLDFEKVGITKIIILEESGKKWESVPYTWTINGKVADYGRGKQIFLSLKYMKQLPKSVA